MPKSAGHDKAEPTEVAFVLLPRFNMMSLAALLEPMRIANYVAPRALYRWEYLSVEAGDVVASNGMRQSTSKLTESGNPETVFI